MTLSLACDPWPGELTTLTWEYVSGELAGRVSFKGWVDYLEHGPRATLGAAVSGLFQRTGVDEASGPIPLTVAPPFTWTDWVQRWPGRNGDVAPDPVATEPRSVR